MSYEELPEIPRIWIDFIHSRLPFLPSFPSMQVLLEHTKTPKIRDQKSDRLHRFIADLKVPASSPALANIKKLQQPETFVIVANFYAGLFGGPAYQILKCLTAIKICEELEKHDVQAVPLCWVSADPPPSFAKRSVTLLNHQAELFQLKLNDSESMDHSPPDRLTGSRISPLLSQIEAIGEGKYDADTLEVLKSVFVPEMNASAASARLISNLMSEWGMVVLNADEPDFEPLKTKTLGPILDSPGRVSSVIQRQAAELAKAGYEGDPSKNIIQTFFAQNALLPMLGIVLDPYELYSCVSALPLLADASLPQPIVWPQPNVTITDSRRRRILAKYNLDLHQLYSGKEEVIREISSAIPHSAVEILNGLKLKVDECIMELEALAPNRKKFTKKAALCRQKILYQLEKLRNHHADARVKREQTVNRQMHKACNLLAPNGRLQERELAGILIPLRHSRAGLRLLYRELDIGKAGHQLISMD